MTSSALIKPISKPALWADDRRVANESEKFIRHGGEQRLPGEKFVAQPMHHRRFGRHLAFGIKITLPGAPSRHMVE